MSEYLCKSCEKSVLFNGGAYCRHFQCVKGIVTGCTSFTPIEQEASPPSLLTNADRIRSMTDEELAEYLCKSIRDGVANVFPTAHYSKEVIEELNKAWLDWLRQEVTDEPREKA